MLETYSLREGVDSPVTTFSDESLAFGELKPKDLKS